MICPTRRSLWKRLTCGENKDFRASFPCRVFGREFFYAAPGSDRRGPPERLIRGDEDRRARPRRRSVAAGRQGRRGGFYPPVSAAPGGHISFRSAHDGKYLGGGGNSAGRFHDAGARSEKV